MITIRKAGTLDAQGMADLLNEIIDIGGTTAIVEQVDRNTLLEWMAHAAHQSAWHVAETESGEILGFQFVEPRKGLPADACDIATFVRVGYSGHGTASKLFEQTKAAARALGYRWINATILADNAGGLAYYQSRGFEDYRHHPNVPLADGQTVDRISKRYDLD